METPQHHLPNKNSDVHGDEHSSPIRNFDELTPAGLSPNVTLSPKIQDIMSQGHAQKLLRIVSCAISKANRTAHDSDPSSDHSEGHQSPNLSASSPVHIDDTDAVREDSGTLSGAADTELSVAETIAELQELVFEWEDLYFQDNDVPPADSNFNVYVWELRGRRPVPISTKSIEFGFGRVYIILYIKSLVPSPLMTCFYWTGHKAHFSSVACAAVHAIQLSRRIGCPKTSRQLEGTETADFFDAIGKFSVVPSPPVPSLQKHIPALHTSYAVLCDPHGYARVEHRLSHAKDMIIRKMALHCVVVDCGKHIYVVTASQINSSSIFHAMRLVQYMKQDRQGKAIVSIIENGTHFSLESIGKYFWSSCDTLESRNSFVEVRDRLENLNGEDTDELCVTDITSGVLASRSFQFKSDSCYVMQSYSFALCVIGTDCSYMCREAAKELANNLIATTKCISMSVLHGLHSINHPLVLACLPAQHITLPPKLSLGRNLRAKTMCRLTKIVSSTFAYSPGTHSSSSSICISLEEMIKAASSPIQQISPVAPRSSPVSSAASIEKLSAATVVNIWVFDGHSTQALSNSDYGVFELHHLYIVQVIRSSAAKGGVYLHRLYFWIGPLLQQRASAIAKIISVSNSVSAHIKKGGNSCSEVETIVFENFRLNTNMCYKPACLGSSILRQTTGSASSHQFLRDGFANHDALVEFSALFKGIFVVDKMGYPSYGLSMPPVALGFIAGRSISTAVCVLMKREVKSLHSLANFCILAPTCVLLWYGRWSDSVSRRLALDFVKCHCKNRLFRTFHEGSEPQEFFSYLEPSHVTGALVDGPPSRVRLPEYLLTAPWWIPRLFSCGLETGLVTVKPCPSPEQQFFDPSTCIIVDTWVSVFVWVAADASVSLVSQCVTLAKSFVAGCPDRRVCPVILEHQNSESCEFRELFIVWHPWPKISVDSQQREHICNSREIVHIVIDRKKRLKHVVPKEFNLKSCEWDQETIARWKMFARGTAAITAVAAPELIATPPAIASPPRTRPLFQGIRSKFAAHNS